MKTIATWTGLIVGIAALVLQFSITIPWRMGNGDTLVGGIHVAIELSETVLEMECGRSVLGFVVPHQVVGLETQ